MPRTREQDELTIVRCGIRAYDCATTADCVRHIQKLTDQLRNPGCGTPAAIRMWDADRDQLLDRLSYLMAVAPGGSL